MNSILLVSILLFAISEIKAQTREVVTLQKDWKFTKGNPKNDEAVNIMNEVKQAVGN